MGLRAVVAVALCCLFSVGCGHAVNNDPLPELRSSSPGQGEVIAASRWFWLEFAQAPFASDLVNLSCDSGQVLLDLEVVAPNTLIAKPHTLLPTGEACSLTWRGQRGTQRLDVRVNQSAAEVIPYDRRDSTDIAPFPDNYWLSEEGLNIPAPTRHEDGRVVIEALTNTFVSDGFSPVTPIVIALPSALDPESIPTTTSDSLALHSSIVLFDSLNKERVAFFTSYRSDTDPDGSLTSHLLLFPAKPLRSQGSYVVVATNRVLTAEQGPMVASEFMESVLKNAPDPSATRGYTRLQPYLYDLAHTIPAGIREQDIALALPFTIRDTSALTDDHQRIAAKAATLPAAGYRIAKVSAAPSDPKVAAIVSGMWQAPVWNEGNALLRDDSGAPTTNGTREVAFTLVLPTSAVDTAAPVIMFQHGSPGTARAQVPWAAGNLGGGEVDFAVVGFTDLNNRSNDGIMLTEALFEELRETKRFPDLLWNIGFAEQRSFVHFLEELHDLDLLPLGQPDGRPDLDTSWLGFFGVSQGANLGAGLVPYSPEFRAAALTVGGGNYAGTMAHQSQAVMDIVFKGYPQLSYSELYVAIALMQIAVDSHDPLNHASKFAPSSEGQTSVLLSEGLGDTLVPAWATQTAAAALGLPQLQPVHLPAEFLEQAASTVEANQTATSTAGFVQYVPANYQGAVPTASCQQGGKTEGHFCPQSAVEATMQRQHFFSTARTQPAPTISDFSMETSSSQAQPLAPLRATTRAATTSAAH